MDGVRTRRALLLLLVALGLAVAGPQPSHDTSRVVAVAAADTAHGVPGRVEPRRATDLLPTHALPSAALPAALRLAVPSRAVVRTGTAGEPSYDGVLVERGRGPPGA